VDPLSGIERAQSSPASVSWQFRCHGASPTMWRSISRIASRRPRVRRCSTSSTLRLSGSLQNAANHPQLNRRSVLSAGLIALLSRRPARAQVAALRTQHRSQAEPGCCDQPRFVDRSNQRRCHDAPIFLDDRAGRADSGRGQDAPESGTPVASEETYRPGLPFGGAIRARVTIARNHTVDGLFLRFYLHENPRHHGILLWDWLLEHAAKLGILGGSAFRNLKLAVFGRLGCTDAITPREVLTPQIRFSPPAPASDPRQRSWLQPCAAGTISRSMRLAFSISATLRSYAACKFSHERASPPK